ncbi:hypothetical protein AVEN_118474-1 [Araneus ventricosus]|uniref:Uncharacterized protein n=1 Tax=Araneus ventricosus TaxID=182803 RepID=A0A4Y1ZMM3_ARAVE|nr:hypothetical protein AVEN_273747-1 [Araneus ventricosus]GBL57670.1 hypothetical protein AVEN_133894-1 [Araneus ventricosus]GBL57707.1 hypothetical protein AVEN_50214-1 [Araneus ventricosus]GBL57871.1 hypothetical protein AVEN_118474-1 [Araneus ventricosus]
MVVAWWEGLSFESKSHWLETQFNQRSAVFVGLIYIRFIGGKASPAGVVRKFGDLSTDSCVVLVIRPRFQITRFIPKETSCSFLKKGLSNL